MKILVVSQYYYPENFRINDLCDGLVERGHEVTVYTGLPNYPQGSFFKGYSLRGPYHEKRGKITVIRAPLITRGKNKSLRLALNFFSFFFSATVLSPFLVKGKFDKIFIYAPSPITVAIPGLFLKFIKKAPVFFWVADLWPESLEATGVVKNKSILKLVGLMVRWMYKFSDKVLLTSKGFIPRVKALGAKDSQIVYFPQWSEAFFSRAPDLTFNDPLIPINGFKVMFAGNIGTSQDFETIIKAAEILKDHTDLYFLILGNGLMKTWAESEVKRIGIEKTFIFLGMKPIEQMPDYYSKADIMLLSLTDTELFAITVPAKLQSYLASGKPVLASINGEAANVVNEYRAGLSVPAGSPDLMAKAILKLQNSSVSELKEMGENAKHCHDQNYDREVLLTKLENLMAQTK